MARPPTKKRDLGTEQKIHHIMGLMRELQFVGGRGPDSTAVALGARWNLSPGYVGKISMIASHRVRKEVTDPDRVTVDVASYMRIMMRDAIASDDPRMKRNGIEAGKVWAHMTGAMSPTKHEITTIAEATPQRAAELVRAQFGAVTPDEPVSIDTPPTAPNPERPDPAK